MVSGLEIANVAAAEARIEEALTIADRLKEGVDPLILAQLTAQLTEAEDALDGRFIVVDII